VRCASRCLSATGSGFAGTTGSPTEGFDTFTGSFAGADGGFATGSGANGGFATGSGADGGFATGFGADGGFATGSGADGGSATVFAAGAGCVLGVGCNSAVGSGAGAGPGFGIGLASAAGLLGAKGAKGGIGLDAAGAGVSVIPASASLTCRDTVSRSASVVPCPRSGYSIGDGCSSVASSDEANSGSFGPSIAGCS